MREGIPKRRAIMSKGNSNVDTRLGEEIQEARAK